MFKVRGYRPFTTAQPIVVPRVEARSEEGYPDAVTNVRPLNDEAFSSHVVYDGAAKPPLLVVKQFVAKDPAKAYRFAAHIDQSLAVPKQLSLAIDPVLGDLQSLVFKGDADFGFDQTYEAFNKYTPDQVIEGCPVFDLAELQEELVTRRPGKVNVHLGKDFVQVILKLSAGGICYRVGGCRFWCDKKTQELLKIEVER